VHSITERGAWFLEAAQCSLFQRDGQRVKHNNRDRNTPQIISRITTLECFLVLNIFIRHSTQASTFVEPKLPLAKFKVVFPKYQVV